MVGFPSTKRISSQILIGVLWLNAMKRKKTEQSEKD